jgi:cytosine/adenosine deaminase-related metal-dependent hydrolase
MSGAAELLRLSSGGRLTVGAPADLIVVRPIETCPFDTLVAASRSDVRLTMIDGRPAIGEPNMHRLFAAAGVSCADATVDGAPRVLARWIANHVSRMRLQEPGLTVPSTHRGSFASTTRSGLWH